MLRAGKAKPQPEAWPKVIKPSATAPGALVSLTKSRTSGADSEGSDCEDRVPVPVFQSSFGDAIEQALNKYNKGGQYWTNIVFIS